ncbi:MAG: 4-alpha-glucanotransferase [Steroidobacteraceae bacterium]
MTADAIEELARLRGIGDAFYNYRGESQQISLATKAALLRAMGLAADNPASVLAALDDARRASWARAIDPVVVLRAGQDRIAVVTRLDEDWITLQYDIALANGTSLVGAAVIRDLDETERSTVDGTIYARRSLSLPANLPLGYHRIELRIGDHPSVSSALIVAPGQCHQHLKYGNSSRVWGLSIQLYSLRSVRDWGIGDFRDLAELVERAASAGADFVGVNPLHASFPANPVHCSPYSPSSRLALNVLYIHPDWLPELSDDAATRSLVLSDHFQHRLQLARAAAHVDYASVAALKLDVFALAYQSFRGRHLEAESERGGAFLRYAAGNGDIARRQAVFDALDEHLQIGVGCASGWQNWPLEYQTFQSPAVEAFIAEYHDRVQFFLWLQWLAAEQLAQVHARALQLGMSVGLYTDLAVGADPNGAETWANRTVFASGVSIGAPPDRLALKGQDWGLPPHDPERLASREFGPFIELLRTNMRFCGALRLDHVMALFRQWWVPRGARADEGGYVHFALDTLMAIVALESVLNRVVVIGEDLGVVPDEVRGAMADYGVYHYKVLLFEKEGKGFRAPQRYERRALATATTHDLPTLRAWWQGDDIALRERLGLYPTPEVAWEIVEERRRDRQHLLASLVASDLLPTTVHHGDDPFDQGLADAIHEFLAASSAELVAVQMEDVIGMVEPVNVPGTSTEYPNWRRKMSASISEVFERAGVTESLRAIARRRAG